MTQTATIGRIVIAHGLSPARNNGAEEAPAIITRVWGRWGLDDETVGWTVNARIIQDGAPAADLWVTSQILFDDQEKADAYIAERREATELPGFVPVHLMWPERVQ